MDNKKGKTKKIFYVLLTVIFLIVASYITATTNPTYNILPSPFNNDISELEVTT